MIAAIICCGIPLLVIVALIAITGVALGDLALVGIGLATAVWLTVRVARRLRARQRTLEHSPTD